MGIDISEINKIIDSIGAAEDILLSDIPCLDLYMDQVTTLFEDKYEGTKRNSKDAVLTKTMINNYTKAKAIMPPKNKKYNRQNIIVLSLIYNLKQILSINDIKTLLTPLLNNLNSQEEDSKNELNKLYSLYIDIKNEDSNNLKQELETKYNSVTDKLSKVNAKDKNNMDLILTVLMLINQAALQKRIAERIIDNYFDSIK